MGIYNKAWFRILHVEILKKERKILSPRICTEHRPALCPCLVWAAWSAAKAPSWILPVSTGWEWLMEQTAHSLVSWRAGCCCKAASGDKSPCESLNGAHLMRRSLKEQEWTWGTKNGERRVSHFPVCRALAWVCSGMLSQHLPSCAGLSEPTMCNQRSPKPEKGALPSWALCVWNPD